MMARNMMSNHSDMQDKYCGHFTDIHFIQSQYQIHQKKASAAESCATSFVVAANACILHSLYIGFESGECRNREHNTV